MAKQNITVKIIGKPFKGFSKEDCLAMAAFQIAVAKLALAQSREVGDEEVKTLAALGGELESYLDALR